tara:strand:- start:3652 stop:4503 length:852 start_codon:yes stop_codon:yes gene_type:complete
MISVSGLTFTYKGAPAPALDGVSFTVPEASVYGLLGPSGAGKSTTQKILMGLLAGYGGTAQVFGEAPARSGRGFYERIGVSFELPALYGRLTARENLALFAALYADAPLAPDAVLDMVDLRDAADQRVETFSKGMKMRLNLARSLLNDPSLLFLDEPTTGQDPARARTTRRLISDLRARGKTVFLTTHNMSEAAEICDTVGFLVDGKIALEGSPAELMVRFGKPELVATARSNGALTTEIFAMEGLATNQAFQDLLQTGDIVSLHTREASLDDIFVSVAGGGQ